MEAGLQERKSARGDVENSIIVVDPTEVINIPPDEDEEEPDCDRHSAVEPEEEDSYSNPLLTRRLRREPDVLSAVMEEEEPSSTRDLGKRSASSRGGSRRFIKVRIPYITLHLNFPDSFCTGFRIRNLSVFDRKSPNGGLNDP